MIGELDEFGVCSADVTELGGSELGQVGLDSQYFSSKYLLQVIYIHGCQTSESDLFSRFAQGL